MLSVFDQAQSDHINRLLPSQNDCAFIWGNKMIWNLCKVDLLVTGLDTIDKNDLLY